MRIIASGLVAGRDYRFDFRAGEARSPEGRTRTLPVGATAAQWAAWFNLAQILLNLDETITKG